MDEQKMSMAEVGLEEIESFDDDGEDLFAADVTDAGKVGETAETAGNPAEGSAPAANPETQEEAGDGSQEPEGSGEKTPEPVAFTVGGKEYRMTMEEMQAAAVRGVEAQAVYQERDALRDSPERQLVARLAAQSGISVEEYVKNVENQLQAAEINRMKEAGMPEEYARRMLELERKEKERAAAEAETRRKEEVNRDFREFVAAYPEVKRFPPEVVQAIKGGQKPLEAYRAYESQQLKAEIAALKKNAENRGKVPGSLQGEGGGTETDPFLEGFGNS